MRLVAALVLMTLPAVAAAPASPWIAGNWFGRGQPDDKTGMYVDRFRPDGSFHSDFRGCVKGKAADSNEDGTWSISGDILTLEVQLHNGAFSPHTEIYRLMSHTAQEFKDVYEGVNFPYDEHRVDAKFTMPDCQLVS
jgi:hypothetical protein